MGDRDRRRIRPAGHAATRRPGDADGSDGFYLEAVGDRWARLHHVPCGKVTRFVNPTDARVRWYMRVHRCGIPGTDWHVSGGDGTAMTVQDASLLTATMRSTANIVEATPLAAFRDGDVYATAQVLAAALENALMTVGRPHHIKPTEP
ncbi:MAG: hypothetical protein ACRD2C_26465 [Acidimicrobiales bacterium]